MACQLMQTSHFGPVNLNMCIFISLHVARATPKSNKMKVLLCMVWFENEHLRSSLVFYQGRISLTNVSERKDKMRLGMTLTTNPKDNSFVVRLS